MQALLLVSLLALDAARAQTALRELEQLCVADAGRLWGRTLCGPAIVVDPATREAVTRTEKGSVAAARIPESVGIANTAVDWEGQRWTMVMAPLPEEAMARRVLLAHESFHRIQADLGFPATGPSNAHLDSLEGRYWLQLEWRALKKAMQCGCDDAARKEAIADALLFRAKRRALIDTAAAEERQLEMHEGLAEYTGTALAEPNVRRRLSHLAKQLEAAETKDGFVRNFAYASGPAWGALLEMRESGWTRTLRASDDLGDLTRLAWSLPESNLATAETRAALYESDKLMTAEQARETKRRDHRNELTRRFVDGSVLVLPLRQMQMQFDPNGLQPLGDAGTVYQTITVTDAWGKIVVTDGALMAPDFTKLTVPRDGKYELTLNEGWSKEAAGPDGSFTLTRK